MSRNWVAFGVVAAVLVLAVAAAIVWRERARALLPPTWLAQLQAWRHGYTIDRQVRIRVADGVELAGTLYLPRDTGGQLATVYIRHTYGRDVDGHGLTGAQLFAEAGYAVLVQDVRGKFDSGGSFEPYRHGTADGAATLDWIVAQPWSNGRVGTWGCSALGELQYVLARARHPAHAAMVPMGAGGAVGAALDRYAYFGVFEGGVPQLASTLGWMGDHGWRTSADRPKSPIDNATLLPLLPSAGLASRIQDRPNSYRDFLTRPLDDPWWQGLDYLGPGDRPDVPAFVVNTWGDQTIGETLAVAEWVRQSSPDGAQQRVLIAPGDHCQMRATGATGRFGVLGVENADRPYFDWTLAWFDHWLRGRGDGLAKLPPYQFFQIGENRWESSGQWPPERATPLSLHLAGGGRANGRSGDGQLVAERPTTEAADRWQHDPADPVPTRGGPVCCTGSAAITAGPADQAEVETRPDVLVYTTPPLAAPLRIAGPLRAVLHVASSAPDTDLVVRLAHVRPDGVSTSIQEGALRARYRHGITRPQWLEPGRTEEMVVDVRAIAYTVPAGHRLRLHVASSSFPRLERNLGVAGPNGLATQPVVARNTLLHGPTHPSRLELFSLPPAP